MRIKHAVARLANARTQCEKADEIMTLVKDQDAYLQDLATIGYVQREVLQIAGRIDSMHRLLTNIENITQQREDDKEP